MASPISLTETLGVPDIMSTHRHELHFPEIPGMGDARGLTIRGASIDIQSMPAIAPVRVPIPHGSIVFSGGLAFDNMFSASFYEDSNATVLTALLAWKSLVSNEFTGEHLLKVNGAVNCLFVAFDTAGEVAYIFELLNTWPQSVNLPQTATDSSSPALITVNFAVDFVDMLTSSNGESGKPRFDPDTSNLSGAGRTDNQPASNAYLSNRYSNYRGMGNAYIEQSFDIFSLPSVRDLLSSGSRISGLSPRTFSSILRSL